MTQLVPVVVAIFLKELSRNKHETWIQKRTYGPLEGQWEFPGGKVEPGEAVWDALVREIKEETNVSVTGDGKLLGIFPHDYGDKRVLLHVFIVPWESKLADAEGKVVSLQKGTTGKEWDVPLLPANFSLVEHLCNALYDEGK